MNWIYIASFALSLFLMSLAVNTASAESGKDHAGVLVFTANRLPALTNVPDNVRMFYLDGADAAMARLRFKNPGSLEQAKSQASAMLQTPDGQSLIDQVTHVGAGIALAWQHGIQKLPAVMVDGTHVVYGVFDIEQAIAQVEEAQPYAF